MKFRRAGRGGCLETKPDETLHHCSHRSKYRIKPVMTTAWKHKRKESCCILILKQQSIGMYATKFSIQEKASLIKVKYKNSDKVRKARVNERPGTICSDRRQLLWTNWKHKEEHICALKRDTTLAPHTSAVPSVHCSAASPRTFLHSPC